MAKRELDNLDLDMIQCKADGFGRNYGKWKAWQKNPMVRKKKDELPLNWKVCPHCGRSFKPTNKGRQIYCEYTCQKEAQKIRDKGKYGKYYRDYAARKRLEKRISNG